MILLADLVLLVHFLWVLAVLVPIPLIWIGARTGWSWVRNPKLRLIHLGMMTIVALEALFGIICPLTTWENLLRQIAHEAPYQRSFIEDWVGRILFYDFPGWVFLAAYLGTWSLILFLFFKYPPRRSPSKAPHSSRSGADDKSPP